MNLVRTQRNVGWGSGSASAGYSSGDSIISFKSGAWNVGKFEGKSFYGASLLLGVKFQFFGEKRDKLGLTIAYNQGVNNLIKTDFSIDLKDQNGVMKNHKGVYASKGSFLTIYASYPITIVKKKLWEH